MSRIILTTVGTGGDVFPFITIGRALAMRSADVVLISNSRYKSAAEAAGLGFIAIDSSEESEASLHDGPLLNTLEGTLAYIERYVLPTVSREISFLRELAGSQRSVIVSRVLPGFAARIVSRQCGVPLLTAFMAPANAVGLPLAAALLRSRFGHALNDLIHDNNGADVCDWDHWLTEARSIGLWPSWFGDCESSEQKKIRPIGFILADDFVDGADVPEILRRRRTGDAPVVLISGGTGLFAGKSFFEKATEICLRAGVYGLISCRQPTLLPDVLPAEFAALSRVNWNTVLPRIHGLIHHGGMGVIGHAMAAAAPQLALAYGGDRPDNSRRLEALGVGVWLNPGEWRPHDAARTLTRVISSDEVRTRCCEVSKLVDSRISIAYACEEILSLLK
jgi:rhamnosyltransferase subunit B